MVFLYTIPLGALIGSHLWSRKVLREYRDRFSATLVDRHNIEAELKLKAKALEEKSDDLYRRLSEASRTILDLTLDRDTWKQRVLSQNKTG